MKRILAFFPCVFLVAAVQLFAAGIAGRKPNIVFILTDDQGYGDLSVHGNPILKTPHLDRLHGESVRFTNWHNSPTCSPTRSALLTGGHEFRNGVTHTIYERERLTLKATTLAQVLRGAGYATGIFGRWHLGDEAEYQPERRGFDEVFIHGGGGLGQSYPGSCGDAPGNGYFNPAILHNGVFERTRGYCTDVFFAQAKKWMERRRDEKKPFLCWLATNAPHGPFIARSGDQARYDGQAPNDEVASFYGMIHNIDENVGALLAALDELGIAQDTLVIFMNDNGGTTGVPVFNAGMRGQKGTPWLGGTRAISFWRWPGTLRPGDCDALTAHLDFFRTLAALAGATLTPELETQTAEGRSLVPLLENPRAPWPDRFLFAHLGRWPKGADPDANQFYNCAVRNSRHALVSVSPRGSERDAPVRPAAWQLFDVQADPAQAHDLAAQKPEVVAQLAAAYDEWWRSLKGQYDVNEFARGPRLNPFAERYRKQVGGGPTPADYERMNPAKAK